MLAVLAKGQRQNFSGGVMRFFESGLVFVIFTALALPFRLSCTLEDFDACEEDGKLECDPLGVSRHTESVATCVGSKINAHPYLL